MKKCCRLVDTSRNSNLQPTGIFTHHLRNSKTYCLWALKSHKGYVCAQLLSCIWLFASPCTVPRQLLCPWHFSGKNTGVGCQFLLQGIFPTQELNPGLPLCRQILYQLSYWAFIKHTLFTGVEFCLDVEGCQLLNVVDAEGWAGCGNLLE